jgi:hypothetical protein
MGRARLITLIAVAMMAIGGTTAHAATFTAPAKLTGPAGGEPSIATDRKGNVYVDGPQGIPSGVNDQAGVGFWSSKDDGSTWGPGRNFGSFLGGGDSDVITTPDATVYIDDLEAVAAQVCKSTDHGATFDSVGPTPDPSHCTNVGEGQVGPSDDRPWLTSDSKGTLYLTYHEFVSAQPLVFRSDNGGADLFGAGPCGSIVTDPAIEANVPTDITGGTLVAKPITDAAGNLYVLFTTTTQAQNAQAFAGGQPSGTFSQLYVAVSHDHCASFTDHTVYDGASKGTNTTQFGDIFNAITADGAGNLYTIGTGYVNSSTAFSPTANVYLFSSSDHGQTWKGPNLIGSTNAAHMLPAATGGPGAGQLAVGYFQTLNGKTDPNDLGGEWTYTTAETGNANAAQPSFSYSDVNPGFVYHHGQVCNQGILCGAVPGGSSDRSLLDFTAATVDAAGCPLFTFAGNPTGTPTTNDNTNTFNYATRQLTGCFQSSPAAATTTSSGAGAAGTIAGAATLLPTAMGKGGALGRVTCIAGNRLRFAINPVPNGRVIRAVAYVNGRKVATRRGANLKGISFARPRATRLVVRIITTNNKGGRVITKRTFTGCTRTKVRGRTKRHKVTRHKAATRR